MQKNIRMLLTLLLGMLMVLSLSACKPENETYVPESAEELWEKVDQTMNALESMEMTGTAKALFFNNGYAFEVSGTTYVLSTKENHYMESKNIVTSKELSIEQTTKVVEAYYNGKMYSAQNYGVYDQKLCSAMTHEEYDEAYGGELTDEIQITECTKAEFSKGENDTWNLKFSGYTKKTIDEVVDSLGLADDILGAPISDMEVNLVADRDFYVKTLEIGFSFTVAEGDPEPMFTVTAEYSGFNTATFDPSKLKAEEYTEVDDLRLVEKVSSALAERQSAPVGKFTLGMETTFEFQGTTQTIKEIDTITYGRKNGAYAYQITAEVNGQAIVIQYQSGEQTVTVGDQTNTGTQTEQEAKFYIDSLIDSARYNADAVTNIQKQEEGVYVLTCEKLDPEEYAELLGGNSVVLTEAYQRITVTFQENKLMKMESKVSLTGTEEGQTLTMVVSSVVAFDDTQETV